MNIRMNNLSFESSLMHCTLSFRGIIKKNKRDEKKRLYGWSHHCDSSKNGISLARIGFASSLMSEKLRFNNSSEMLSI